MASEPLRFYHRYRRAIETEAIYGEAWLRWAYETPTGRFATWLVARRPLFSRYFGWRMSWRASGRHVFPFIVDYNLDADEFAKSAFEYRTFNEFFTRALKPSARPIAEPENARLAVFPADGRHLGFANVDDAPGFYVKGAKFTLSELLGDDALGASYAGGAMIISRLCPVDYHRFHFPVRGCRTMVTSSASGSIPSARSRCGAMCGVWSKTSGASRRSKVRSLAGWR
jgi:phosphatidylserine decarboxylase